LVSASAETYLALGVVVVVALLVVPLRPFVLDALLALSFAVSIVVLLVTLSARDPLEFSIFPSLLLLITLLRLGLNVSSTRLILSTGHAGEVIRAFGGFVIGGNYVVGLVIFLILVVINFLVITKGAGRIAEVAARFTLDAMPGRQMSIDADLSAGLIDESEARRRREEINHYADFYGSMDGAAKFVRGDAIAGLVITAINLIGGFTIGMLQRGMSAEDALATYSSLSVGDGLVTQIPALVVSTSAGILVTYGSRGLTMAPAIASQLTRNPRTIWVASGILAVFAVVPGLPALPFLLLAGISATVAYRVGRKMRDEAAAVSVEVVGQAEVDADKATPLQDLLTVEPLELEVGYALVPLVDEEQGGDLLKRIGIMRKQLALELGIIVPPARIRDNIQLKATEYSIKLRGVRVASSEIMPRHLLALDTAGDAAPIEGIRTKDPSFAIAATWITGDRRVEAESLGYHVVEPQTVLATHLMETIRGHAAELISRQDTRELLDGLKETHPALIEDVIPNKLSLGTVHRVLQRLLREGVPVRDLVTVLEALSDASEQTKDPEMLAEHARRALSPVIVEMFKDGSGVISAITVGPRLEAALMQLFSPRTKVEGSRTLEPQEITGLLQSLSELANRTKRDGEMIPLIAPPSLRVGIRRLVEPVVPRLPVISLSELPTQTPVQSLVTWELDDVA
jgi:flagellar biosynthesis protein FlhA